MSGSNFNQLVFVKLKAHCFPPNAASIFAFLGNLGI